MLKLAHFARISPLALLCLFAAPVRGQAPIQPGSEFYEKFCDAIDQIEGWRDALKADAADQTSSTAEASAKMLPLAERRLERAKEAKDRIGTGAPPVLHTDPNYTRDSIRERRANSAACTTPPWIFVLRNAVPVLDTCRVSASGIQDGEAVVFDEDAFDLAGPGVLEFPLAVCHEAWRLDQQYVEYESTGQVLDLALTAGLPATGFLSVDQVKELIDSQVNHIVLLAADASFMRYLGTTHPTGSQAANASGLYADGFLKVVDRSKRTINLLLPLTGIPGVRPACPPPVLPI